MEICFRLKMPVSNANTSHPSISRYFKTFPKVEACDLVSKAKGVSSVSGSTRYQLISLVRSTNSLHDPVRQRWLKIKAFTIPQSNLCVSSLIKFLKAWIAKQESWIRPAGLALSW